MRIRNKHLGIQLKNGSWICNIPELHYCYRFPGEIPDAGVEDAAEPDEETNDAGRVHGGGARLQLRQPIRDKLSKRLTNKSYAITHPWGERKLGQIHDYYK